MRNPLSRAASSRRYTISAPDEDALADDERAATQHANTDADEELEYQELDGIAPLPLYALMDVDLAVDGNEKAANMETSRGVYDSLFNDDASDDDELDELLQRADATSRSSRSRHSSTCSDAHPLTATANVFSSRHNHALTELLTHIQLPGTRARACNAHVHSATLVGLSSVDQMHLLAVANTISHFSSNVIDKLVQANARKCGGPRL